MKRLPSQCHQHHVAYQRYRQQPAIIGPALVLSDAGFQELPEWAWFLAVSSPILVVIIALIIGISVLLFIVWRRTRRPQPAVADDDLTPPSLQPIPDEEEGTIVQADQVDTVESPAVNPSGKDESAEIEDALTTIPVGTVTVDDLATVPSMPERPTVFEPQTLPILGERPPDITWQIAGLTDVGLKRDHNEDSMLLTEATMPDNTPFGLYVVADGLGGHQGGEIASDLSIKAIQERFIDTPPDQSAAPYEEWLREVALAANKSILSHQEDQNQAKKMGSTLIMALITPRQAHIANVGDSRAYRLNDEGIHQISVDHSLVERLVQIGQLTREEARTHRNRNVIYNTLGDKPDPEISLYHVSLEPGDRLLLCSDGLNDMVPDEQLLELSRSHPSPSDACKEMVVEAKRAGGNDNITAIIIQIDE